MPDGATVRGQIADPSPASQLNHAIDLDRAGETARARDLMRHLADILLDWDEPPLRLAESLPKIERLVSEQPTSGESPVFIARDTLAKMDTWLSQFIVSFE